MYTGKTITVADFSGGLASNIATTTQTMNQASDLDNIVVFSNGKGFRKRYGNTLFNSSAMNSGAAVQGVGYYKQVAGTEYLLAVAGTKLYQSAFNGTMTDITGSLSLTAGNNDQWSFVSFNNKVIGFGGAPDAPFVWTGSGNASALAGSPPSAYNGFQVNNRIFAYRTSSNPSTIYWSVLANQADWTGTGSGSSSVSLSDNDSLTAHAVLNNNTVLLFKQGSIHQMVTTTAINNAFPIFPLFSGVGCAGKGAVVVVRGLVYFITPTGRMRVTDGNKIFTEADIPNLGLINDKWSALNQSRLPFIQGIHIEGLDYEHIVWYVSSSGSSTNDISLVWDLRNQCWLQNTTGHAMNCATKTQTGTVYVGNYAGKLFVQDGGITAVTDASNASAPVAGYWTSGWGAQGNFEDIKQLRQLTVAYKTQDGGNFEIAYGYDFNAFQVSFTVPQSSPGAQWDVDQWDVGMWGVQLDLIKPGQRFTGRGNVFQYRIRSTNAFNTTINSLMFSGKEYGQKRITAS